MLGVMALMIVLAQEQAKQEAQPKLSIQVLQPAKIKAGADCHFIPPYCGACPWFVEYPPLAEPVGEPVATPKTPEIPK